MTPTGSADLNLTLSPTNPFGALGDYARVFLTGMLDEGYAEVTWLKATNCLSRLGREMLATGQSLQRLDQQYIFDFMKTVGGRPKNPFTARLTQKLFLSLVAQGAVIPSPLSAHELIVNELKQSFAQFERHQRGLQESTIRSHWYKAKAFMAFCFTDQNWNTANLTPRDVTNYLLRSARLINGVTQRREPLTPLKIFFLFLFQTNRNQKNLADCVPRLRRRRDARVPRYFSADQVEQILETVKASAPRRGKRRDYAMLLIMGRLGLRAMEVRVIRLEDIDWDAGELLVRGKGRYHQKMPIPEDVGRAISDYIRFERPITPSREVFVHNTKPYGPFKYGSHLNRILTSALQALGLEQPAPFIGSHVLRHSVATAIARKGGSLEEIQDFLRHHSPATTLIYAKLDLSPLRALALPWPSKGEG